MTDKSEVIRTLGLSEFDVKPVDYVLIGLVFENVQKINPFPFKGKQGIGFLSDADKSKIKLLTKLTTWKKSDL